jgi:hypothetical protein
MSERVGHPRRVLTPRRVIAPRRGLQEIVASPSVSPFQLAARIAHLMIENRGLQASRDAALARVRELAPQNVVVSLESESGSASTTEDCRRGGQCRIQHHGLTTRRLSLAISMGGTEVTIPNIVGYSYERWERVLAGEGCLHFHSAGNTDSERWGRVEIDGREFVVVTEALPGSVAVTVRLPTLLVVEPIRQTLRWLGSHMVAFGRDIDSPDDGSSQSLSCSSPDTESSQL